MLMTNSYVLYCKFVKLHNAIPMSQYDFRKKIALAWISRDKYGPTDLAPSRDQSVTSVTNSPQMNLQESFTDITSDSGISTRSMFTASQNSRSKRFSDASLHPQGDLRIRLDWSHRHLAAPNFKSEAYCQLHWWAKKNFFRKSLAKCVICKVNLCLQCFERFHSVDQLVTKKDKIGADVDEVWNQVMTTSTTNMV